MDDVRTEPDLLAEYLTGRDVDCPVCRYNLRGTRTVRCPECGAHLRLRVGSIDLKLSAWLVGVLALALPMGFSMVMGIAGLIGMRRSLNWAKEDWIILALMWGLVVVYGITLLVVSRRRARFLRRSGRSQWIRTTIVSIVSVGIQLAAIGLAFPA